jgi:D-tagatose-1,6-bisphosphate aldolase subunit GatZ/KbaZ
LIRDGFAILKVGPALTFALRETLYALSAIERELVPLAKQARLIETIETVMLDHPANWQKYYHGTPEEQRLLRVYSYSDRIRYYWGFPEVQSSIQRLIQNLEQRPVPETLLSAHCPRQYDQIRAGKLQSSPKELVIANIMTVLNTYSQACSGNG